MKFNNNQKIYIDNKKLGVQIIKGNEGTGKTTSSLYKAVKLENSYCIFERDEIAFITSTENNVKNAENIYLEAKKETFLDSLTLFSTDKDKIKFFTIEEIVNSYSNSYIGKKKIKTTFIDQIKKQNIIQEIIGEKRYLYKKSKIIKEKNLYFLIDEIDWIREKNLSKDDYLEIKRHRREKRLRKNSLTRIGIYDICIDYEKFLLKNGLMDFNQMVKFAIAEGNKQDKNFAHIFIDDCEKLTESQFQFINNIYSNKSYSTFTIILNNQKGIKNESWIPKRRRQFLFTEKFKATKILNTLSSLENYTYINLKNKNKMDLSIDLSLARKELIVKDNNCNNTYIEKELKAIPMYSDIAAGEPIPMNSEQQSSFHLPYIWFKGSKEIFILRIKGDSMKNTDIKDGDLVVIRRQHTAEHNDIVAVDLEGSATLKRLNLKEQYPKLMPENTKYLPISLEEREAHILGIAIGVIKLK